MILVRRYKNPDKILIIQKSLSAKTQTTPVFWNSRRQKVASFLDPVTKNSTPVDISHIKVNPVSFQDPLGH